MSLNKLIWVDGIAALLSAIFVLSLKSILSGFLQISIPVLLLMSIISFAYATYSISLALLKKKPIYRIKLLVKGNIIWAACCIIFIIYLIKTINIFGVIYLVSESLFVTVLAWFEYKQLQNIKSK